MTVSRREYKLLFPFCMVCGDQATDVHEIARGVHRKKAVSDRRAWLSLCRRCHDQMGDYSKWPLERQYALKAIADVDYYDRAGLNEMRSRKRDAISEQDVMREVPPLVRWVRQ